MFQIYKKARFIAILLLLASCLDSKEPTITENCKSNPVLRQTIKLIALDTGYRCVPSIFCKRTIGVEIPPHFGGGNLTGARQWRQNRPAASLQATAHCRRQS